MPSVDIPNYKASVVLHVQQQAYTGIHLSVLLHRKNIKYPLKAIMLICPQNEQSKHHTAILWLMTSNARIVLNETIIFELINITNSLFLEDEKDQNKMTFPIKVTGEITSLYQTAKEQLIGQSTIKKKIL